MGDLAKLLERFIARDLIFVTGGGLVIASFLHLVNRLPTTGHSNVFYALLVGLAYFVGLAMQDLFSLFGLVTTATVRNIDKGWLPAWKLAPVSYTHLRAHET